jgi:ribosomal protein S9
MVRVSGGGHTGQSQAIRHGLARALQNWAPELRPALKAEGALMLLHVLPLYAGGWWTNLQRPPL